MTQINISSSDPPPQPSTSTGPSTPKRVLPCPKTHAVGTVVEVESRQGPGWKGGNGGAGKIRRVVVGEDGSVTYTVKYFMNGSEKGILPEYVSLPKAMEQREVVKPVDYAPEDFVAVAAARATARDEVARRRRAKKERSEQEKVAIERRGEENKKRRRAKLAAKKKQKTAARAEDGAVEEEVVPSPEPSEDEKRRRTKRPVNETGKKKRKAASVTTRTEEGDDDDESEEVVPAPQRPPPPPGRDAVTRTLVRLTRDTGADEFETDAFVAALAENATLERAEVDAALAYLEVENRIMLSAGVIFVI